MAARLLNAALLVLTLLITGSAGAHTLAGNKQAALRDARVLIGRVRLPAGAVQSAGEPAGGGTALANPASSIATTALIDIHQWWQTPGSMSSVLAFVKGHAPHGGKLSFTGSGSLNGKTTNESVAYSFAAVRDVLFERQLVIDVAPLAPGLVGVRVDAEVEWTVPRRASERVPRRAHALTVTRTTLPGWPPPLSLTVTGARVSRLATLLDRLPVVQPVTVACPMLFPAPMVTLAFSAVPGGRQLARATMPVDGPGGPCAPIVFSVRGHRERPLLAQPSFLRKASHILGVTLR